jgi:hypothetical protein
MEIAVLRQRHPLQQIRIYEGFEVFEAVTKKNAEFWDVAQCGFIINQHFG